jgi:hypothetical protein
MLTEACEACEAASSSSRMELSLFFSLVETLSSYIQNSGCNFYAEVVQSQDNSARATDSLLAGLMGAIGKVISHVFQAFVFC